MLGDPQDTPILPQADYRRVMGRLSSQYEMLKKGAPLGTQYAQGLMQNLNPEVNPGGSQGLISGLERIVRGS